MRQKRRSANMQSPTPSTLQSARVGRVGLWAWAGGSDETARPWPLVPSGSFPPPLSHPMVPRPSGAWRSDRNAPLDALTNQQYTEESALVLPM
ncbi:MAG: hypothetical protein HQL64_07940 [Magnetococcales bacterium]|nr:hypothetical protein [Magnetococcales bacterium]